MRVSNLQPASETRSNHLGRSARRGRALVLNALAPKAPVQARFGAEGSL